MVMPQTKKVFIASLHADFDAISAYFLALKAEASTIAAAADLMTEALRAGNPSASPR